MKETKEEIRTNKIAFIRGIAKYLNKDLWQLYKYRLSPYGVNIIYGYNGLYNVRDIPYTTIRTTLKEYNCETYAKALKEFHRQYIRHIFNDYIKKGLS